MAEIHQLTKPVEGIACHAWNRDKSSKIFIIIKIY
jgi:hypothetical protein